MAEVTTNSEIQITDPKLDEFNTKIASLQEQLTYVGSYVTAYNIDGMFNMSPTITAIKEGSTYLFKEAQKIRNEEEGLDINSTYGTYIKVVRDPEKVLTAVSPREFTISDIVYYQYTDDYNTEDKQKVKLDNGKTPNKIFKTVKRNLENSTYFINLKKTWKEQCKVYKNWLDNIGKYEDIQKQIASTEEKMQKYIQSKEEKAQKAQAKEQKEQDKASDKFNKSKAKEQFEERIRTYTAEPQKFLSYKSANGFFVQFYMGPPLLIEIYTSMGLGIEGEKRKTEIEEFDKLAKDAEKLIEIANTTRDTFEQEYIKNKSAQPDYTAIEQAYNVWIAAYKKFDEEIHKNKIDAQTQYGQRVQDARNNADTVSDEAKKEESKPELSDNIKPETIEKMEDKRAQGTLEGKTGSPDAPSQPGEISETETTQVVVTFFNGKEKEQEQQNISKTFLDEDTWTSENETKIKSKKSGLTESQQQEAAIDMPTVLTNVASNIVGAVMTDPSLAQTVVGMASTGTFDVQSLEGLGNTMLASSVNTLSNAMMNTLGVGAVEDIMDDALRATTTIVTTATNIVPMLKELTVAAVTTVTEELTSHVIDKVESILDPSAIMSQIQYYTSYYTQQYTKGLDDLKQILLTPGDLSIENALEAKNDEAKSAKMQNMLVKINNIKNKVGEGIVMAKNGVNMVTTYINNGPDWVIKQLSTYTNFAISQAEKYIDYGADYVIDQRDMWIAMTAETIGKRIAEKANAKLEQITKKTLDYIEVKKKYVTQVAMAAIMTAVQIVVGKLGPLMGKVLKAGAKIGMKQLLKTIGG